MNNIHSSILKKVESVQKLDNSKTAPTSLLENDSIVVAVYYLNHAIDNSVDRQQLLSSESLSIAYSDEIDTKYLQNSDFKYFILSRRHYDDILKERVMSKDEQSALLSLSEKLIDGILVVDMQGKIRYANPATCKLFQKSSDELVGSPFGFPIADDENVEITLLRPTGTPSTVEMRANPIVWQGEYALLASMRDITEQHLLRVKLEEFANRDSLTGLYNHRVFYSMLEDEIMRSERNKRELSLLMLDIDYFKKVNDTYGHQPGDMILGQISKLFIKCVREIDRVCRYGGEEITMILPETDSAAAAEVAERIRKEVEEKRFDIGDNRYISITISIGVSTYPIDVESGPDLVSAADAAMYEAKRNGRNQVVSYKNIQR